MRLEMRNMDVFTVSFFGHRVIDDFIQVERQVELLIRDLLMENAFVEFLVGRDGEFDLMVSSVIRRCKRALRAENSAHVWVLPYMTAELRNNEESYRAYYDEIELSFCAVGRHFKGAHQARNREMVDRSHLVVFCVQHESGGAWQTMQYAKKQGVPYLNIGELLGERK